METGNGVGEQRAEMGLWKSFYFYRCQFEFRFKSLLIHMSDQSEYMSQIQAGTDLGN